MLVLHLALHRVNSRPKRNTNAICHEKSLPDSLLTSRQNAHHGSDLSKLWIVLNVTSVSGRVQKILKTILSTSRLDGENEMFGISMLQL